MAKSSSLNNNDKSMYYPRIIPSLLKTLGKNKNHFVAGLLLDWLDNHLWGTTKPKATGKPLGHHKYNLKGFWRYRIGNRRVISKIEPSKHRVLILDIRPRNSVYTASEVRRIKCRWKNWQAR